MKRVCTASAAVVKVPDVARVPLQPPDAVQPVAPVDDQVSVAVPWGATVAGLAEKVTVGCGVLVSAKPQVP